MRSLDKNVKIQNRSVHLVSSEHEKIKSIDKSLNLLLILKSKEKQRLRSKTWIWSLSPSLSPSSSLSHLLSLFISLLIFLPGVHYSLEFATPEMLTHYFRQRRSPSCKMGTASSVTVITFIRFAPQTVYLIPLPLLFAMPLSLTEKINIKRYFCRKYFWKLADLQ